MQQIRPLILTIAGYDPTGGAGVLADIKTFEQLKTYGFAISTGMTNQLPDKFYSVEWRNINLVKTELKTLLSNFNINAVKFGIAPSFSYLKELIDIIKNMIPDMPIVLDPVVNASSGFKINKGKRKILISLLHNITLLTPNYNEIKWLIPDNENNIENECKLLSEYCYILLKGGHNEKHKGVDLLFYKNKKFTIDKQALSVYPKHGSGCVLSAAITAYIAKGYSVYESSVFAKRYVEKFLSSNNSLLGYHVQ